MSNDSEKISDLYERYAEQWDQRRDRGLVEKSWLDRFLTHLPPGSTILDMGCGGGEPIARYLMERGCRVTGIDSSPTMIGMCRSRFPAQEWIVSDMRSLDLKRRFDGIIAWDSFFHLNEDHQRRMFPIFASHTKPGAPLIFTSGPSQGEAIGIFQGERLYHGSLDASEYRSLLAGSGFEVESHVVEDPTCVNHTIWLALGKYRYSERSEESPALRE